MNGTHLRTLLWLRWRLTVNQWRRGGELNAVITMLLLFLGLFFALAGTVAGVAGGSLLLSGASPMATMLAWDGMVTVFLIFWTASLLAELQQSDMTDVTHLLHLPVSLRDVFLLNYLASHINLIVVILLPTMLGMAAGVALGRGPAMLLLLPLVLGFFFMVTAWTQCLRGWLAALMINKRRRRAILMGLGMAFVLLTQLPYLASNVWPGGGRRAFSSPTQPGTQGRAARRGPTLEQITAVLEQAHRYVPVLWLPQGARSLAGGNPWPSVWGGVGMFTLGAWGLARAYRSTLRFHLGDHVNRPAPATAAVLPARPRGTLLVERSLPAIPSDAAALALTTFRAMSRAPEVKMSLVTSCLVVVILAVGALVRGPGVLPPVLQPFVACATAAVTLVGLTQLMFNHFGFDRHGFRSLVLLPTPRRNILLGKNLAVLPAALAVFAVLLGLAAVLARLRTATLLTAGLSFCSAFLTVSVLGNLASILAPYRIAEGSLKPTKTGFLTQALILAAHMLLPLAMLPIFIPPALGLLCDHFHWMSGTPVMLLGSALVLALSTLFYRLTLGPLGALLQGRERAILQVVTREVE